MRNRASIVIALLAAVIGGFLLYTTPLRAADPTPIACPNSQTILLEGQAPPGEAVLAYLRGRPIGGGLTDRAGHYRLPLRAHERPGAYPVEVRLRTSHALVGSFTCFVEVAVGGDLTPTATLAGTTPQPTRAAPASTVRPTAVGVPTQAMVNATPTRTATIRPVGTPTATVGSQTGSASATPASATPASTAPASTTASIATATTTPSLTATPSSASAVTIESVELYDPLFPDASEYALIHNASTLSFNLTGWRLVNVTRAGAVTDFTFPGYTLGRSTNVSVYSGAGTNDATSLYWGQADIVWRVGDRAELRDGQGNLIATMIVPPLN
ncbi:MAG: lamin tail domain-containing protein [Chloroflexales bacterium]